MIFPPLERRHKAENFAEERTFSADSEQRWSERRGNIGCPRRHLMNTTNKSNTISFISSRFPGEISSWLVIAYEPLPWQRISIMRNHSAIAELFTKKTESFFFLPFLNNQNVTRYDTPSLCPTAALCCRSHVLLKPIQKKLFECILSIETCRILIKVIIIIFFAARRRLG